MVIRHQCSVANLVEYLNDRVIPGVSGPMLEFYGLGFGLVG